MKAIRLRDVMAIGVGLFPLFFPVAIYLLCRAFFDTTLVLTLTMCAGLLVSVLWPIFYTVWWAVSRTRFAAVLFWVALVASGICFTYCYFDPGGRIRSTLAG